MLSSLQGAKMEASWLQNSLPLGPCLKNGVNLESISIPILKIRFWHVQGHVFSSHVGSFLIYVRVGFRTPFGRSLFRFLGHVGGQLGVILGPCWGPRCACWGHFCHLNLAQSSQRLRGPILRAQKPGPVIRRQQRQVQFDCLCGL